MDTLAALALATDKPDDDVLNRKPMGRTAPLISTSMWKMILGQSCMQLIVTFTIHFGGDKIFFGSGHITDHEKAQIDALTFNTFVWLQFFKLFVTRKLDEGDGLTTVKERITKSNLNFFEHFFRNWYFVAIACIIGGFQILIMFVGGAAFSIAHQTGAMWGTAIICGLLSFPVGLCIRIIPDIWVERIFPTRLFNCVMSYCHRFTKIFKRNKDKSVDVDDIESNSNTNTVSTDTNGIDSCCGASKVNGKNILKVGDSNKRNEGAPSSLNSELTGTTACPTLDSNSNCGISSAATSVITN
ncbi:unnamed protein product [Ambrosiozyma monospora]|uniref:Unnamed protein product n=1 Tax=Ambrosiozyma monospora TaxID=43982 RepID=A0A9W6YXU2_AMBMO|nr:unnamed protein product [Ambrosiozyma monospora]